MIMVCWRGTYSAKTTQSYSKPTSVVPLETCKDPNGGKESFLYGIFKLTVEMIHTIVEAATYLATNFLKATQPKSVTILDKSNTLLQHAEQVISIYLNKTDDKEYPINNKLVGLIKHFKLRIK